MARVANEGQVKNGYLFEECINEGNFARAYRASKAGKIYFVKQYTAVKKIKETELKFNQYKAHLEKIKALIDSIPFGVLKTLEVFESGPMMYTVHEWMTGKDLLKMLKEFDLTIKQRFAFSTIFVSVLSELHKKGLVHVDLKPEQLFLQEASNTKFGYIIHISDFDFSWIKDKSGRTISRPEETVTTLFYSSPEHLQQKDPEFKSDVFTTAIILYLTLFSPPPGKGGPLSAHPFALPEIAYEDAVLQEKIAFIPKEKYPWISQKVSDILVSALSRDPSKRPTAQNLCEVFQSEFNDSVPPWNYSKKFKNIDIQRQSGISVPEAKMIKFRLNSNPQKFLMDWNPNLHTLTLSSFKILGLDKTILNSFSSKVIEIRKNNTSWQIKGCYPEEGRKRVFYDNKDITNIWVTLSEGKKLKIGDAEMAVELVKK